MKNKLITICLAMLTLYGQSSAIDKVDEIRKASEESKHKQMLTFQLCMNSSVKEEILPFVPMEVCTQIWSTLDAVTQLKTSLPIIRYSMMDEFPVDDYKTPEPKKGERFYYYFVTDHVDQQAKDPRLNHKNFHYGQISGSDGTLKFLAFYLFQKNNIKSCCDKEQTCNLKFTPDDSEIEFKVDHFYEITDICSHVPKSDFDIFLKEKLQSALITEASDTQFRYETEFAYLSIEDVEDSGKPMRMDTYKRRYPKQKVYDIYLEPLYGDTFYSAYDSLAKSIELPDIINKRVSEILKKQKFT